MPELLLLGQGEQDAAALALANASDAAAHAEESPLALPPPFEAEIALAEMRSSYRLRRRLAGTSHGEVWRAIRAEDPTGTPLILKRLRLDKRGPYLTAGLRERHFGRRLRGVPHVARYIDAFERDGSLWCVYICHAPHPTPAPCAPT